MNTQEQIGKLQGLLERIQRNAARPRTSAAAVPAVAAAPAPASTDALDELLDSPAPSPLPVDVDVVLESVPPEGDALPIPLVSTASVSAPTDDPLDLDSEVSEVRVTTGMREPAVEVTVAAIAAEAETVAAEELSEEDLVEVTEATSAPPPAATDVDIDFEDEDEQPPASSQRSRVASSMDEALQAAAAAREAEREVPIKTPPPESGPQEAPLPAGLTAPPAPDVDALLGQELEIPTRAMEAAGVGPTPEQLGQTVELEDAAGPELELAEHDVPSIPAPAADEDLELTIPGRNALGRYDDGIASAAPEAHAELDAPPRTSEIIAPPEAPAEPPSVPSEAAAAELAGPEVVTRTTPLGSPETFSSVRESFRPRSFVELLDASLSLSGE